MAVLPKPTLLPRLLTSLLVALAAAAAAAAEDVSSTSAAAESVATESSAESSGAATEETSGSDDGQISDAAEAKILSNSNAAIIAVCVLAALLFVCLAASFVRRIGQERSRKHAPTDMEAIKQVPEKVVASLGGRPAYDEDGRLRTIDDTRTAFLSTVMKLEHNRRSDVGDLYHSELAYVEAAENEAAHHRQ
ncbi:hypothetical protein HK405_013807 [Cladochytrium tenue]|nr:hypothetical protein HK405_013807 [Cladochytrium tenue]